MTRALLRGSRAIDASPSTGISSGADARLLRRGSTGGRPDRGAFDYYQGTVADERIPFSNWATLLPIDSRGELDDPNGDGIPNIVSMYFVEIPATSPRKLVVIEVTSGSP